MTLHAICVRRACSVARATVVLFAIVLGSGASANAAPVRPDLVADRPGTPHLEVNSSYYGSARLLLRFDGFVHNVGPGSLEIRGSRGSSQQTHLMTSVIQRILDSGGGSGDSAIPGGVIRYETNDQHNHWHFMSAARYSLWRGDRSASVAPAHKVGFCLLDGQNVEGIAAKRYTDPCRTGSPSATSVFMGLAPGWRDVYEWQTALQWIDVSNVAPGSYMVSSEVDPDNRVRETNEANPRNWGSAAAVVPGYLARPVGAGELLAGGGTVTLSAQSFGRPGASSPQFRITDAPDHGTLNKGTGGWFSGGGLTYTPQLGYRGPDSFRYVARDGSSQFPSGPPSAAVTLQVGGLALQTVVAISGAPAQLYSGTSAQLSAAVTNGPSPRVTWKVNGVTGGSDALGRISASGRYVAPAVPPPGGSVGVSATSDDGAADSVRIAIRPRPPPTPAPSVALTPGVTAPTRRGAIPRLALSRHGRRLVVKLLTRRSGRLRIVIRRGAGGGAKRIASRRIRATRGRPVSINFLLPRAYRGWRARQLRVNVALHARGGRVVAFRKARVR